MVGTQMITKGFDLPGVTLVGVVMADLGLNLPDFRSAERTFQLLTQVAGRAGRGERLGRVLIQTYAPHHYSIRAARDQDYARFIRRELRLRRELGCPPYSRMALVRIEGADAAAVAAMAERAATALRSQVAGREGRCDARARTGAGADRTLAWALSMAGRGEIDRGGRDARGSRVDAGATRRPRCARRRFRRHRSRPGQYALSQCCGWAAHASVGEKPTHVIGCKVLTYVPRRLP